MKALITTVLLTTSAQLHAETYLYKGEKFTKIEAIKILFADPSLIVERCYEVELTDNLTLKNKKQPKKPTKDEVK